MDTEWYAADAGIRGIHLLGGGNKEIYHVIHQESGKVTTLDHQEVNDIFADSSGRIIVCRTDLELYWLLADSDTVLDESTDE